MRLEGTTGSNHGLYGCAKGFHHQTSPSPLRACFENGWRGRLARPGRRPADRNCRKQRCEKAVPIGANCRSGSVRRVAGRHRRVACATNKPFFKHAQRRGRMRLAPISRRNFIKRLRHLGWEGPLSGGKHEFMVKGPQKLPIPNPHRGGQISVAKLRGILREIEVSPEDWNAAD